MGDIHENLGRNLSYLPPFLALLPPVRLPGFQQSSSPEQPLFRPHITSPHLLPKNFEANRGEVDEVKHGCRLERVEDSHARCEEGVETRGGFDMLNSRRSIMLPLSHSSTTKLRTSPSTTIYEQVADSSKQLMSTLEAHLSAAQNGTKGLEGKVARALIFTHLDVSDENWPPKLHTVEDNWLVL
ncbi:hypothetical protein CPB83DRAFT_898308 [Crepidotus variabilis]|uniref:Uncharacterized protein n=1 Tax=Crepidotus variabilis TaxID=179855 RepID=A0A9P6E7K8_9AGAR|nr:hypothetical protein CPB83DRAFT_898308 [Crepidotus variabilis]